MTKKLTNPYDLTDDEARALTSTRIPDAVKAFTARRQAQMGTETAALMKVAARARAEVEALHALRQLDHVHGEVADIEEAKQAIDAMRRRLEAVEITGRQKDREIERLTAAPAAAIHSGD